MKVKMLACALSFILAALVSVCFFQPAIASEIMGIPSPPLSVDPVNPVYTVDALSGDGQVVAGVLTNYLDSEEELGYGDYIGLFRWTKEDGFLFFFEDTTPFSTMRYKTAELNYDGTAVGFGNEWLTMGGYWYSSFRYSDDNGFEWLEGPDPEWDYPQVA